MSGFDQYPVLNECASCNMKFETAAQLANHVKKFCSDSSYHNLESLNKKYNDLQRGTSTLGNKYASSGLQNLGAMSVSQAKGIMKTQDASFMQLERVAQKKREDDLEEQLRNYKQDRQQFRQQQKQGDDAALASLQTQYDSRKEPKTPNVAFKNYKDLAIDEKSEKIKSLREQQDQLEKERVRIMSNLDKVKNNDVKGLQRSQLGKAGASLVSLNQPNQLGDQYRPGSQQLNGYGGNAQGGRDIQGHSQKMLDDIQKIKDDYFRAGGNDPRVLQNMDNLNKFYSNVRTQSARGLNDTDLAISPATGQFAGNIGGFPTFNNNGNPFNGGVGMENNQMGQNARQLQQQVSQLERENQKQKALIQQEQEQNRLKAELEALQRGGGLGAIGNSLPVIPGMVQGMQGIDPFQQPANNAIIFGKNGAPIIPTNQNNYTLSDINSKLHGYEEHGANPFSIFTPQQEFLIQNEVRTVDLDDEERMLANLAKEEVDQLRILSRIPVGTELYRFKMEQYKELSTVKAEMEKIANEQKLQRARMEFEYERREEDREFDNEKWNDDQRKWILAQRIRKDLGPVGGMKQYDQNDGLVIHWDYILGLPKRTNFSQVVFGIFNKNDTLYPPKIVDPKECEVESAETVRCIIGDSHQIFDIPPNQDNLLIMEVQLPYSKKKGDTANKTESYGWTQLDLFDVKRELKRGKFKCPLYYPPTDQAISVHEIKHLEPIPGAWIYLRVAYPNDDDFSKQRSRYPEQTMHEYVIPYIHLRNDLGARQAYKMKPPQGEFPDGSQLPNMSYLPDNSQGGIDEPDEEEYIEQPPDDGVRRGLSVSVLNLDNHVAESNMMVSSALIQSNKPVYDDQNRMCSFTTSVHNPFLEEHMEDLPQHVVIPLQKQIQRGEMMNNKQFGESVKWNEEYKFLKNIPQLYWSADRKDIYVGFQVKEKDKPKNMQDPAELQNYNGTFNMVGWNFVKVNRPDGSIRSGIYTIDLFKGQLQRPPIDEEAMLKTGKTLTVVIQEFVYDDSQFRAKTPPTKDKPKPAAEVKPDIDDVDNSPYIENFKPQFKTKTFQKRMGIDFYIDALRFLPDKVTATKVYMQVYNIDYEEIFEKETCLPELDSFSFNPMFNFRRELRKDHIDPTSIVLLTVITIDKATNETRIVGYAVVPLFITTGPNPVHPTDKNISDVFLYSGAYQLPLISQQIKRVVPFSCQKMYELEKLPCASILVRIVAAPMDEKGIRPLSINDFTDQKIWLEKGLFRPRPQYGRKIYNTSWYKATDAENDLFPFRALREDISIKEAAYLIIKGKKINKRFKNTELYDYLDENIALTDDNKLMDMMYFAKYSQQAGVKFALDGLHQVPNEGQLYVTFFSINPPFGGFYPYLPSGNESDEDDPEDAQNAEYKTYLARKNDLKNYREVQMSEATSTLKRVQDPQEQQKIIHQANLLPPDTTEVNLSSFFLWESAAQSPQYNDQWSTFNKSFNRYQVVIVDVKSISFKKVDPQFEDVGWTIVPLFSHDGYVNSGIFQVPLIKGPVNAQFLYELRRKNKRKYANENRRDRRQPWELLLEKMEQKRSGLRFLEFTSIICRVLDAQRQGHFAVRFDTDRMDYDYLPKDKKPKYSYNEAVVIKLKEKKKLSSNIPGKENPANFNKKITDACIQGYNLVRYL